MNRLRRIAIKGFKSIKDMDLVLRPLNVLIGANGSGKTNLISFFGMLDEMMSGRLQEYIRRSGKAQSLLHHEPASSPQLEARLEFASDSGFYNVRHGYFMSLSLAPSETLVFAEETLSYWKDDPIWEGPPKTVPLGSGHRETGIIDGASRGVPLAPHFLVLLEHCRVYDFHNTSATARARQSGRVGDDRWLLPDAGNLAAYLFRLKNQDTGTAYKRIVSAIRLIAPFFRDFDLVPSGREFFLNWRDTESDQIFGPHQLSDGTLRAICLIALLLQPDDEFPAVIVLDEPELSLHPYALHLVASLFKKASHHCTILISTQSSSFLDNFEPKDVVVAEREGKESIFRRPDPAPLEPWRDDYSLGEIWEKNIIGGGPH